MLENPANRNHDRCGKCLPVLIKILEELEQPSDAALEMSILIVATLNKCTFEESLIQLQIKYNIIDVLLKKLHWIVGDSKTIEREHKKKKYKSNQLLSRRLEWILGDRNEPKYGKRRRCVCLDNSRMNIGFQNVS